MRQSYKALILLFGDIVVLYASLAAMLFVRYGSFSNAPALGEHILSFSILFAVWIVIFYIHNLYALTAAKNNLEFFTALTRAVLLNIIVAIALFYFIPFFGIAPKRNLFITLAFFVVLFSLWRQIINRTLRRVSGQNVMLIGPLVEVARMADIFEHNPQIGYRVKIAFAERRPQLDSPLPFFLHTPEDFSQMVALAHHYRIRTVVVSSEAYRNARIVAELEKLFPEEIEIVSLEEMQERIERRVRLDRIDELWFFNHFARNRRLTYGTIKSVVDRIIAIFLFPFAFVLGLFIVGAIKLDDRGPIFYKQRRVGEHGRIFTMLKFRTMRLDAEQKGAQWTVKNDPRVTRVGGWLRKTRLDELPQLINVLWGEMAFVGPRAERPEFHDLLKKEIPFYDRRYLIKPGLTGWAQINYTYGSSIEDTRHKLAYDFYYVKNRSFVFDLGVILKTLDLVLRGSGR